MISISLSPGEAIVCHKCLTAWKVEETPSRDHRGCVLGTDTSEVIHCSDDCLATIFNVMTQKSGEKY